MLKIGIVGGTGYTGVELLRLLAHHPKAELAVITSRAEAGTRVDHMFPSLRGVIDLGFTEPDTAALAECDVVFFATPHAVAMNAMAELASHDVRVIDLSADFRVRDIALWEQWYGCKHACPDLVSEAVYGLPEMNRDAIRQGKIIAAPGCYPTAILLGFLPLVEKGMIDMDTLIASAVSGVTGAGRAAKLDTLFAEVNDSFKPYAVSGHRHLPELEQGLFDASGKQSRLTFVPHMVPMTRGILATLYARLDQGVEAAIDEIHAIYEARFQQEAFVDVLPYGQQPQTRSVKGSNMCRIAVEKPQGREQLVITAAIDNLVKGASGQAVHIMNIMFDLDETLGLNIVPLSP